MARRFHQVPTHISTPEPVLSVGPFSLTAKQFLLLLLGSALSYRVWQLGSNWSIPLGQALQWGLAALPVCVAIAVAFVRLADRPLEHWGRVIARFWAGSRLLLWRSLRHDPDHLPQLEESARVSMLHTFFRSSR